MDATPQRDPGRRSLSTTCCIVGGGPAGMMLGVLLGRAGVDTIVLEKHADFLRDFRGDTVHPSTMRVLHELGWLDAFLQRPHQKLVRIGGDFGGRYLHVADFSKLDVPAKFIAMMPQWDFLDFLAEQGARYPSLKLLRKTEAVDLIEDGGRVAGVVAKTAEGSLEIEADLVIGCDGRHSITRARAGLEVEDIGAPIDVLWFRIGRSKQQIEPAFLHAVAGGFLVTIDRGDYWQCAYIIGKGQTDAVKARGLDAFRAGIVAIVPALAEHIADVKSWDDVKLLTVTIDRLRHWSRPGLLCIGDAAHAMSPVGGVGINLAIADAVATANALAEKLRTRGVTAADLDAVQARRLLPVKIIQGVQVAVQNRIINPALHGQIDPPALLRLVDAVPALQRLPAMLIGLGVRAEHVRSPITTP
ncbi:FAD-dependent oxidoreductase [Rhodopseudomonas sp. B29]|uniref:FAD-dependent oxidoreductase n=1 Tax=Rhodopseudomonas sp. B29 TaxID=95607 RepID=UPI0003496F87|nr:FAD-dependent oxidoreductase [Rhodopseudomonas sp. B29]